MPDPKRKEEIRSFYLNSFRFFLTHAYQISIPFQSICFILTKSDLYAQKMGQTDALDDFLAEQDAFQITQKIIGTQSL